MEYLQSLSDYLIKHITSKADLEAWAQDGELLFSPSVAEEGYELRYMCSFELSDVEVKPARLFMLIANWVQQYNPDRDTQGLDAPLFFVEPLANNRYDLGVKMEFIEQMKFVEDVNGEWLVEGKKKTLQSDFQEPFDADNAEQLIIFDGHSQDNGLHN
ncbi:phage tail protein [Psychromonas aquimarina]|uniref:phage tail protein n=1 Tax=Psychromonas aquimarina TaxID=444919 RepID=UPI0003FB818C|nr:phage tail protein [Psychromonas aquimarina]